MAVFPQNRDLKSEIGHDHESLPVPFPCLRTSVKTNENPGRTKSSGNLDVSECKETELPQTEYVVQEQFKRNNRDVPPNSFDL
jgi:hypothetical protein